MTRFSAKVKAERKRERRGKKWRGAQRRGEGIPKSCICAYSKRIIKQKRKESKIEGSPSEKPHLS